MLSGTDEFLGSMFLMLKDMLYAKKSVFIGQCTKKLTFWALIYILLSWERNDRRNIEK